MTHYRIFDFVNLMSQVGRYDLSEIPAVAMQSYHADYYFAQVYNGGHAQFVGNAGANIERILSDIDIGLLAMGAVQHHEVFSKLLRWIADNPAEVAKQTGFNGGISAELQELDTAYFSLSDKEPLSSLNASWVASLPIVEFVEDTRWRHLMRETALMNPKKKARDTSIRIAKLNKLFSDPTQLSLGMAVTSMEKTETIIALGGAFPMDANGKQEMIWTLSTTRGNRFHIV